MLPVWLYDRYDMSDDNTSRERHKIWWRYLWRIVLFTLFLLYPGMHACMHGWMDGWMDGWRLTYITLHILSCISCYIVLCYVRVDDAFLRDDCVIIMCTI
jgi:hypothetical protein